MPKVYSKRAGSPPLPAGAVLVDRTTPWGNPFLCRYESSDPQHIHGRARACAEFAKYAEARLSREPHWLDTLRGKDLVCWCAPLRCHAETLLRLANPDLIDHSPLKGGPTTDPS